MTPGTRTRRCLQIAGRALALLVVFAATFVAVSLALDEFEHWAPIDLAYLPPLAGVSVCTTVVFGWALADGLRPKPLDRPVKLWAVSIALAALVATALVLGFWIFLAASMGGSVNRDDTVWVLGLSVLVSVLVSAAGAAVAAGGVWLGRTMSLR